LIITKKSFEFRKLPIEFEIEKSIEDLLLGITKYYENKPEARTFVMKNQADSLYLHNARLIYDKVFLPIRTDLRPNLLILPGECLYRVPFEALVATDPERMDRYKTYDYLIKHYKIRYAWSEGLAHELSEQSTADANVENKMLGMAPFATSDTSRMADLDFTRNRDANRFIEDKLSTIPYSGIEVFMGQKFFGGEVKYWQEATKSYFMDHASKYRYLLLATHGSENMKFHELGWLAFPPLSGDTSYQYLLANEVYGLDLHADMVVLTGCNTGKGLMYFSDGEMSIARAFVAAGAKSVLSTSWKVNDAATAQLSYSYFKRLHQGATKSDALRQAKISFFESPAKQEIRKLEKQNIDWTRFAHPYFWAAFSIWGDDAPLRK
jgi:CHAT domain-containing protein